MATVRSLLMVFVAFWRNGWAMNNACSMRLSAAALIDRRSMIRKSFMTSHFNCHFFQSSAVGWWLATTEGAGDPRGVALGRKPR